MALTYFEISYPNFTLGSIINPEEANQNNYEIVTKVNDIIGIINKNEEDVTDLTEFKANISYVDEEILKLSGEGRTFETVVQNAKNLINHRASSDHDSRYYTKQELSPWLRGGETLRKEEVFKIIESNNGDGTFTYITNGELKTGVINDEGHQIFTLTRGSYRLDGSMIEVFINDTLRRSKRSGGLDEISETSFGLTYPEGSGAEVTAVYLERLGMAAEYNIKLSDVTPPLNDGKTLWLEIINN